MRSSIALSMVGLLLFASSAAAGNRAGAFSLSPVAGGITFEGKQHLKTAPLYGLRAGYNFTQALGVEGAFDYSLTKFTTRDQKVDMFRYGGELLYHFMPESSFVPYVAAGYNAIQFRKDTPLQTGRKPRGMADYGIGAKWFLSDCFALRADARHLLYSVGKIQQSVEYTLGLHIPFGGVAKKEAPPAPMLESSQPKAAPAAPKAVVEPTPAPAPAIAPPPPAPIDSDGDGVPDDQDKCPGTPPGIQVDKNGCPLDSDGDGVPDYLDKCTGTPAGVKVDKNGCPLDSDGDGVPDTLDRCPDTPAGKVVDRDGCPLPEIFQEGAKKAAASGSKEIKIDLRIEFDTGKAVIKPKYDPRLKQVAEAMVKYPKVTAIIEGHTDNVGKPAMNQKLSERRAAAVKNYIVKKYKISANRIKTVGYGLTKPIATNKTAAGRAQNRRIEGAFSGLVQ